LRELEERFSWMKEADTHMLRLGLEPYPWEQYAEEISKTGEMEFRAIEQRANAEQVLREDCPPDIESVVGATLVIRSHTTVTALNMVRSAENAPQATARMLFKMADALPEGAQVNIIISTAAVLVTLGACADILTHGWDIGHFCQDPEWKNMMETWRNKQIRAVCRKVDEQGLDEENSPFLSLAAAGVRQMITDVANWDQGAPEKELEPESSDQ
jgi:hypothetical protein